MVYNTFASEVELFNKIAGNTSKLSIEDFKAQQLCLIEEVNEITEGLDNNDIEEVVDGVIDTLFVALGMLQRLEYLGIDTSCAIKRVCENNLSKFPKADENIIHQTIEYYKDKGIEVVAEEYIADGYKFSVFRDTNGKIRKPVDFKSVTLSGLVEGIEFK